MMAGAVFGLGWWAWADALVTASQNIPFAQWLPGLVASLALVLVNSVRWDEINAVDPWGDDGTYCRSRVWMLVAYAACFGAVAGAVVVMIHAGGGGVGLACVLQVVAILGSALLFFASRSEGEAGGDGYSMF
jgi:hypothetical protein